VALPTHRTHQRRKEMDCVTMKLVERSTVLPLDLVVLINSFLYERLTDENFKQAIALWFENKEECKFRFGHISDWKTSRVTNMEMAFYGRDDFSEDIGRWDAQFDRDISRWNVSSTTNVKQMLTGTTLFTGDLSHWGAQDFHERCDEWCDLCNLYY
jgi:hypothetical protein